MSCDLIIQALSTSPLHLLVTFSYLPWEVRLGKREQVQIPIGHSVPCQCGSCTRVGGSGAEQWTKSGSHYLSVKDTHRTLPRAAMTTRVRVSCDAHGINVTETLFPHQSPGLWPRDGSSPNHDDAFFWEEYEIEHVLPLVLL